MNSRGFTLIETIVVISILLTTAASVFFLVLFARALLKYVNS